LPHFCRCRGLGGFAGDSPFSISFLFGFPPLLLGELLTGFLFGL
jgi:hypothetical protein